MIDPFAEVQSDRSKLYEVRLELYEVRRELWKLKNEIKIIIDTRTDKNADDVLKEIASLLETV